MDAVALFERMATLLPWIIGHILPSRATLCLSEAWAPGELRHLLAPVRGVRAATAANTLLNVPIRLPVHTDLLAFASQTRRHALPRR